MTETEISLSFPHFAGKFSIGKNRSARGKNAHHIGLFGFSTFYTETTSYYFYLFFLFYIILRESRKNFKKAHARRVEKVAGIDRFEEQTRSALPQNYQQIIKNKFFDTSSVSLRLPPSPTGEGLQYFCQRRHFPMSAPLLRPARFAVA